MALLDFSHNISRQKKKKKKNPTSNYFSFMGESVGRNKSFMSDNTVGKLISHQMGSNMKDIYYNFPCSFV